MSFDDRLRDELRKAAESQPLDTDRALHRVRGTQPAPAGPLPAGEPEVVALEDVETPRRRQVRLQHVVGVAAALALIAGAVAVPYALRTHPHDTAHRLTPHVVKNVKNGKNEKNDKLGLNPVALEAVASALNATTSSGSYHVTYTLHENPSTAPTTTVCQPINEYPANVKSDQFEQSSSGATGKDAGIISPQGPSGPQGPTGPMVGDGPAPNSPIGPSAGSTRTPVTECFSGGATNNVTTTGTATVNVNPFAMEAVSNVSSFGPVTVQVDDTDYWETAGTGPTPSSGAGQPISSFAGLVEGTLGPREGAGAMMGLSSPTGYLSIARQAITGAAAIGTGTVNGRPVTNYRVNVDPSLLAGVPGLSPEELTTINGAIAVLQAQGFTGNSTDVSVDANGFVVQTVSTNSFADGGTVVSEDVFSDFGCAGAVQLPGRPSDTTASACTDPATATTTTAPAVSTTTTTAVLHMGDGTLEGPTGPSGPGSTVPSAGVAGPTTTIAPAQAP